MRTGACLIGDASWDGGRNGGNDFAISQDGLIGF
jgi:hypothetical protein